MEMMREKVKKRGLLRKLAIALFCIAILAIVTVVLFKAYDPTLNSLGALSSLCMDVISIIILVILTGSFAFGKYEITRTSKIFLCLLLATIWALFLDFLNWAFDGTLAFGELTYWFTVGSLCMGAILGCIFSLYLYSYLQENHGMDCMHMSARVCAIINVISFFVTFTLALTGTAFKFDGGHYETGALYDIVTALPVVTLLYLVGYTMFYIKKIGAHDVWSAAGYIVFMITGALIEGEYSIGTTYVSVALADLFIFVMLQNEVISLEKRNVEKWIKRSYTDELTGIPNRYAYETEITRLEEGEIPDNFVYASVDVNGLKSVNDTQGHTAGDELVIGAGECLRKTFGAYGTIYRMGGDEFVVLFYADAALLPKLKDTLMAEGTKWSEKHNLNMSLSCGYVVAKEERDLTIKRIAILADKRMYEAKAAYYRTTGIERRKSEI